MYLKDQKSTFKKSLPGVRVSRAFLVYLIYILFVVFTEWFNFTAKIFSVIFPAGTAEILSLFCVVYIIFLKSKNYYYIKNTRITDMSVNFWQIAGMITIGCFGIMMSVYPDTGFDTLNYHLIAQNPLFENYFTEDFGYGHFQVWGFRLSDRLFYYFRFFLGYRLGTLLNTFVLILSFVQLYAFIWQILPEYTKYHTFNFFISTWTLIILFPLDAIFMFGSYYVDVLALPIGLEVLRLLINSTSKHVELPAFDVYCFALLNGLWMALKLTNIVFVLPCILLYIFFHYKQMQVKHWIGAIALFLFPFIIYLFFNFLCTGNPVFPYFNSIFRSDYFDFVDFKDSRFGGRTLFEKCCWIVYAALIPSYHQSELPELLPPVALIFGIAASIVLSVFFFFRKKLSPRFSSVFLNKYAIISCLAFVSSVLWGLSTGYSRYYIFGKLLWGVLAFIVMNLIANHSKAGKTFSFLCTVFCMILLSFNFKSVLSGRNWKWTAFEPTSFAQESTECLHDNDIVDHSLLGADAYVLTDQESMGVVELLDRNAYVINTNYPLFSTFKSGLYNTKLNGANPPL